MSIEKTLKSIIEEALTPTHFEVINESHKHLGHMGDNGSGETHFKLIIVSSVFEGLSRIERQRLINDLISPLFKSGLHAISLKLSTP